jgi:hypothetical protein
MADQVLDTETQRVTIRTPRGNVIIGPADHIEGLWRLVQRELRTGDQVRKLAGGVTRHTLLAWRKRAKDPFPAPVVTLPYGRASVELWSRTAVESWLARRTRS